MVGSYGAGEWRRLYNNNDVDGGDWGKEVSIVDRCWPTLFSVAISNFVESSIVISLMSFSYYVLLHLNQHIIILN